MTVHHLYVLAHSFLDIADMLTSRTTVTSTLIYTPTTPAVLEATPVVPLNLTVTSRVQEHHPQEHHPFASSMLTLPKFSSNGTTVDPAPSRFETVMHLTMTDRVKQDHAFASSISKLSTLLSSGTTITPMLSILGSSIASSSMVPNITIAVSKTRQSQIPVVSVSQTTGANGSLSSEMTSFVTSSSPSTSYATSMPAPSNSSDSNQFDSETNDFLNGFDGSPNATLDDDAPTTTMTRIIDGNTVLYLPPGETSPPMHLPDTAPTASPTNDPAWGNASAPYAHPKKNVPAIIAASLLLSVPGTGSAGVLVYKWTSPRAKFARDMIRYWQKKIPNKPLSPKEAEIKFKEQEQEILDGFTRDLINVQKEIPLRLLDNGKALFNQVAKFISAREARWPGGLFSGPEIDLMNEHMPRPFNTLWKSPQFQSPRGKDITIDPGTIDGFCYLSEYTTGYGTCGRGPPPKAPNQPQNRPRPPPDNSDPDSSKNKGSVSEDPHSDPGNEPAGSETSDGSYRSALEHQKPKKKVHWEVELTDPSKSSDNKKGKGKASDDSFEWDGTDPVSGPETDPNDPSPYIMSGGIGSPGSSDTGSESSDGSSGWDGTDPVSGPETDPNGPSPYMMSGGLGDPNSGSEDSSLANGADGAAGSRGGSLAGNGGPNSGLPQNPNVGSPQNGLLGNGPYSNGTHGNASYGNGTRGSSGFKGASTNNTTHIVAGLSSSTMVSASISTIPTAVLPEGTPYFSNGTTTASWTTIPASNTTRSAAPSAVGSLSLSSVTTNGSWTMTSTSISTLQTLAPASGMLSLHNGTATVYNPVMHAVNSTVTLTVTADPDATNSADSSTQSSPVSVVVVTKWLTDIFPDIDLAPTPIPVFTEVVTAEFTAKFTAYTVVNSVVTVTPEPTPESKPSTPKPICNNINGWTNCCLRHPDGHNECYGDGHGRRPKEQCDMTKGKHKDCCEYDGEGVPVACYEGGRKLSAKEKAAMAAEFIFGLP